MTPLQHSLFILSVQNIAEARRFYRDIVGLGAPKLDSNFWVEFALNDTCSFCLEQNDSAEQTPRGKITCVFLVPDLLEFRQRYESAGFHDSIGEMHTMFGENVFAFLDSEGNTLYITDRNHS